MSTAAKNHRRARCAECVEGVRWCPQCESHLPSGAFKSKHDGWCANCYAAKKRERYRDDPEYRQDARDRAKAYRADRPGSPRDARLRRRSGWARQGMDPDEVEAKFAEHDGLCEICGTAEPRMPGFVPDHDHRTGRVRGIICPDCNQALGFAKDDIFILESMVRYLRDDH